MFWLSSAYSQVLRREDFRIGALDLNVSFDSVASALGVPDSIKTFDEEHDFHDYTAYYYKTGVVWSDNHDGKIWAFDVYDSSQVTHRGLRIGDSVSTLERLYGKRGWVEEKFSRVGPYDYSFRDYTEATIFEYYETTSWYLIVFTKDQKVVKLLFYIGVYE